MDCVFLGANNGEPSLLRKGQYIKILVVIQLPKCQYSILKTTDQTALFEDTSMPPDICGAGNYSYFICRTDLIGHP